ncbi:MAG: guanylate kinase [Thermomicrobiales bacterium]|nr:guanylate kinase [Thermomicrobiales bacterium]
MHLTHHQEPGSLTTPADHDEQLQQLYAEGDALIAKIREANAPRIFIISGPSGVGKDSVIEQLRETFPNAKYVVTATTRPMRAGEIDGVHYKFLSREKFEADIAAGGFIENAMVYDNHYGVPKQPILDGLAEDRDVIIKVDVKGAATLRELIPNTISIFLAPETMDALLQRLRDRKTDDPEVLMKRFRTASIELAQVEYFDYVVFNEDEQLDTAVQSIVDIVNTERLRVHRPEIMLA